jgi:hypothetical protein
MAYGNVEFWWLSVTENGRTYGVKCNSWEAATDAFREVIKRQPTSATVFAVQKRTRREIKTWDYAAPQAVS